MYKMILYLLSLLLLLGSALVLHLVGDYLLQNDFVAKKKVSRWNWRQVVHLLANHDHRVIAADKEETTRRDYFQSWLANGVHMATHFTVLGLGFWFTSKFLLDFPMRHKFGESFHPFHIIGPETMCWWLVVNTGLHGFIDRRWPVRFWMKLTGSKGFIEQGGMEHNDQAMHKVCLWLTTMLIPVVQVLLS